MGIVKPYTARRIADITIVEDTIDREYAARIFALETKENLKDIIIDYEEFLPAGLQRFQDCDDCSFKELLFQINRFKERVFKKQPLPAEPTEAVMFLTPPMITIPRGFARNMSQELGKYITWGRGFHKLKNEGLISKLQSAQETMYRKIIEIKEMINDKVDTRSSITESDMKSIIPMNEPGPTKH